MYAACRAAQMGYRGRVRLTVLIINDVPFEPLVLRRLDEHSGVLLMEMASLRSFPPKSTEYALSDPPDQISRVYYALARRIAAAFGASRPQFMADPDAKVGDDQLARTPGLDRI